MTLGLAMCSASSEPAPTECAQLLDSRKMNLSGEPDAGNPHVRLRSGGSRAGADARPGSYSTVRRLLSPAAAKKLDATPLTPCEAFLFSALRRTGDGGVVLALRTSASHPPEPRAVSEEINIPVDEPVPEWAVRYNARTIRGRPSPATRWRWRWTPAAAAAPCARCWWSAAASRSRGWTRGPAASWTGMATRTRARPPSASCARRRASQAPEFVEALGSYSRNGRDPRQFAGYRDERRASGSPAARA